MAFYDLSKSDRTRVVADLSTNMHQALACGNIQEVLGVFSDDDTYIRKSAYLVFGRLFFSYPELRETYLLCMNQAFEATDCKTRQTAINAAGEIGKKEFSIVVHLFDAGLFDPHHSVRNAVIGSVKKMGEVNPEPVLAWAQNYLHHGDKEIRREICHGIELRGRKHPQDILPLLKQLEFDRTTRVRKTLIHVIGQIAYKKGCLPVVIDALKTWENKPLVNAALAEIIEVHDCYRNFAALSQAEATNQIEAVFGKIKLADCQ